MSKEQVVFKILSADDWCVADAEGVSRTALDERDGYVHLSTRDQVGETLALHYARASDVRLLEYSLDAVEVMGPVRWEPSRGGDLFPHLYGALKISEATRTWVLSLDSRGVPRLPEDL
ncbi:MAG: DUF952 domain-containing protein [Pseudomonadota bacterium]